MIVLSNQYLHHHSYLSPLLQHFFNIFLPSITHVRCNYYKSSDLHLRLISQPFHQSWRLILLYFTNNHTTTLNMINVCVVIDVKVVQKDVNCWPISISRTWQTAESNLEVMHGLVDTYLHTYMLGGLHSFYV